MSRLGAPLSPQSCGLRFCRCSRRLQHSCSTPVTSGSRVVAYTLGRARASIDGIVPHAFGGHLWPPLLLPGVQATALDAMHGSRDGSQHRRRKSTNDLGIASRVGAIHASSAVLRSTTRVSYHTRCAARVTKQRAQRSDIQASVTQRFIGRNCGASTAPNCRGALQHVVHLPDSGRSAPPRFRRGSQR